MCFIIFLVLLFFRMRDRWVTIFCSIMDRSPSMSQHFVGIVCEVCKAPLVEIFLPKPKHANVCSCNVACSHGVTDLGCGKRGLRWGGLWWECVLAWFVHLPRILYSSLFVYLFANCFFIYFFVYLFMYVFAYLFMYCSYFICDFDILCFTHSKMVLF